MAGGERGRGTKRDHARFTFIMAQQDLCALHCGTGTCTRASPLRAEQRVVIVLLIRMVGLIIGHRHRNGGGQALTPPAAGSGPTAGAAA